MILVTEFVKLKQIDNPIKQYFRRSPYIRRVNQTKAAHTIK